MASNVYECMFILDSNRFARDPGGISSQLTDMIEKAQGKVRASRLWNEQKLAYQINGHRKGTYWLTYFEMPSGQVKEFDRSVRLNDNVLRHLTLRVDTRLFEAIVSHVRGEAPEAGDEPESSSDGDATAATDSNEKATAETSS